MWKKDVSLALMISLSFVLLVHGDFGRYIMQDEWIDLWLEKQVELDGIVKIVKSDTGDHSACVDIYKQPAFQHPLLKNHKLQLKPTIIPKEFNDERLFKGAKTTNFNSIYTTCPPNTIPILIRKKKNFKDSTLSTENNTLLYRFALLEMTHYPDDIFYGASTHFKVDNPHCEDGQNTGASIWIASDLSDQKNVIKAGWMVYPEVYGDTHTRFSVYWTSDGFHKTGCYDILCPGFVQVDKDVTLGVTLTSTNFHKSSSWQTVFFFIFQDISTQHWWLGVHNLAGILYVGYWPKEIFSRFSQGATVLNIGGSVMAHAGQQFPPMGDGYFPDGRTEDSNFFQQFKYVNKSNYFGPPRSSGTKFHMDNPNCYRLIYVERNQENASEESSRFLFVGGPGGQC